MVSSKLDKNFYIELSSCLRNRKNNIDNRILESTTSIYKTLRNTIEEMVLPVVDYYYIWVENETLQKCNWNYQQRNVLLIKHKFVCYFD